MKSGHVLICGNAGHMYQPEIAESLRVWLLQMPPLAAAGLRGWRRPHSLCHEHALPSTPRRTALISGGTKGLGLEMAKHAAAAGQKALVLMSRKPTMSKAQLAELAQQGSAVFVVKCDAGDASATAAVRRWVAERLPAVQTNAHAAGRWATTSSRTSRPRASWRSLAPRCKISLQCSTCHRSVATKPNYMTAAVMHQQAGLAQCKAASMLCQGALLTAALCDGLPLACTGHSSTKNGQPAAVYLSNHMQVIIQVTGATACAPPDLTPEHTSLLSSTAAVWSQAGAAHYAAGNVFLDATAAAATAAGLPTTAINFGPFRCDYCCGCCWHKQCVVLLC